MSSEADRIARTALLLLESHDHDGFLETLPAPRLSSPTAGARKGVERVYTLASPMRVSLVPEGLKHRFTKLFVRELQTGDEAFDARVYIRTDTPELTGAWLDVSSLRSAVLPLIESGGRVEIDGVTVTLAAWSDDDPGATLDDRTAATILAHVEAVTRAPEH